MLDCFEDFDVVHQINFLDVTELGEFLAETWFDVRVFLGNVFHHDCVVWRGAVFLVDFGFNHSLTSAEYYSEEKLCYSRSNWEMKAVVCLIFHPVYWVRKGKTVEVALRTWREKIGLRMVFILLVSLVDFENSWVTERSLEVVDDVGDTLNYE